MTAIEKHAAELNGLTGETGDPQAPMFQRARYAKGMVAVRCTSNGTGNKTRAMRLCAATSARWSGREKAYIMSPAAAVKVKRAYEANKDARLGDRNGKLDWIME